MTKTLLVVQTILVLGLYLAGWAVLTAPKPRPDVLTELRMTTPAGEQYAELYLDMEDCWRALTKVDRSVRAECVIQ